MAGRPGWTSSFLPTAFGLGLWGGILAVLASSGTQAYFILLTVTVVVGGATSAFLWITGQLKGTAIPRVDLWAEMILATTCLGPIVLLWVIAERGLSWIVGGFLVLPGEAAFVLYLWIWRKA